MSKPAPAYKDPWVWAVLAAALILRLAYLWDLRATPFFDAPQMDAGFHDAWAHRLAGGDWRGTEVFFRAPGYPYFLGVLYALGLGPLGVRVVHMILGTVTVYLAMAFAIPRFGSWPGRLAGLLLACCGPLIYFEGELLLVVLEAPLFLVSLWTWVRAREAPESRGRWMAAGAALGAASLVRPIGLAVVPVVLLELLWRRRGPGVIRGILYTVGLLAVLSPALVRNYVVGGDVVPVASQGGWNFYLGNHAGADGRAALAEGMRPDWKGGLEDMEFEAERALNRELKPSEVSRYWYGRAWDWAAEDPVRFLGHQIKKLGYFWDAFELPNNQDYYYFANLTRVFQVPLVTFGLIGPLALWGLVVGLMRKRLPFPLLVFPLILMAVIVAFFICGRFRAPLLPLFALWAAVGLEGALAWARERRWLSLAAGGLVLAGAALFINGDVHGFQERHTTAESHFRLGVFYAAQGNPEEAEAAYRRALDVNPGFVDAWNNLGTLYGERGNLARAREALERAYRLDAEHIKTNSNLAGLEMRLGNRERALMHARAVDERVTYDADALYNAAVVFGNLGEVDRARDLFSRILRHRPDHSGARLGLARALVLRDAREEAREVLESVPPEDRTPDMNQLLQQLGGALPRR